MLPPWRPERLPVLLTSDQPAILSTADFVARKAFELGILRGATRLWNTC